MLKPTELYTYLLCYRIPASSHLRNKRMIEGAAHRGIITWTRESWARFLISRGHLHMNRQTDRPSPCRVLPQYLK